MRKIRGELAASISTRMFCAQQPQLNIHRMTPRIRIDKANPIKRLLQTSVFFLTDTSSAGCFEFFNYKSAKKRVSITHYRFIAPSSPCHRPHHHHHHRLTRPPSPCSPPEMKTTPSIPCQNDSCAQITFRIRRFAICYIHECSEVTCTVQTYCPTTPTICLLLSEPPRTLADQTTLCTPNMRPMLPGSAKARVPGMYLHVGH